MRAVLDAVAPHVVMITETNVRHEENISYFGEDQDEAHMVYQFPLPPLTLDAFIRKDARHLQEWAKSLDTQGGKYSFFNFLASHDGIGILPTLGILSDDEREHMIKTVKKRGGRVSYKATVNGDIPYEMNISYLSAICDKDVPLETRKRSINRQKLKLAYFIDEVRTPGTLRNRIYEGYVAMLRARQCSAAFDPKGSQEVMVLSRCVFGLVRKSPNGKEKVLCLINVSDRKDGVVFHQSLLLENAEYDLCDIISGDIIYPPIKDGRFNLRIDPYGVVFLKAKTFS
jgi:sucrose phosphorylase